MTGTLGILSGSLLGVLAVIGLFKIKEVWGDRTMFVVWSAALVLLIAAIIQEAN